MRRHYLYPLWLRLWHASNAMLFLVLILSGLSLHYSRPGSPFLGFETAMVLHNAAGVLLALAYVGWFLFNLGSGNVRSYLPRMKRFFRDQRIQATYYLSGIFRGDPHPFPVHPKRKFNPLQQVTYFSIMYLLMPLIIVSGLFLLFPEYAPDSLWGWGGIWPMATGHTVVGFLLSAFMFGHLYLATTGHTLTSNFKGMITGWHED